MKRVRRIRRKRGRSGSRLAGFLVIVVMALYIPAMWKWFLTPGIETGIIQEDTLELKVPMTGVFVRKETLLRAPDNGVMLPEARYGERIPANGTVASFLSNGSEDAYLQYRSAETDILRRVAKAAAESGDTKARSLGQLTAQETSQLALAANAGDISSVTAMRNTIDRRFSEQIRSLAEGEGTVQYLEEEKAELQRLKTRMNKSVTPIVTAQPGIVCYRYDGYESALGPESITSLTQGAIALMTQTEVSDAGWVTPEEIPVRTDEPYAKLVQNEASWLVFLVRADVGRTISTKLEAARLQAYTLSMEVEVDGVEGRLRLAMESVTLPENGKGEALLVGRLTRRVEQTMELRKVSGELVVQSLKGMKVPRNALRNRNSVDGTADLMLVKMNKASLRRVQVLGEQDAWAVVGNLDNGGASDRVSVYDLYLQNPDGVLDGQALQP